MRANIRCEDSRGVIEIVGFNPTVSMTLLNLHPLSHFTKMFMLDPGVFIETAENDPTV
jgi:hypothetical protein